MTKEINLQREVTQEFGKNAAQTTAAVSDKLGNTQSYERYQAAKTLLEAKLQNTDSETEKAAVRATLGQVNAYLAENQSRYDTWKEGGIGRSILHGAAGGLTTGSLGGILAGGGTSLAAPYLDKAAENLGPAGKATVNALGGAAIGYAAGGNVGTAAVGANVDWNNRQLHDSEIKKIKDNAAKFAKLHPGISQRQAEERLVAQAMRQVDAAYYTKHADTDTAAEQFLRSIAGSFKTDGETFLDFAPMKYYRDSGKFAEQQGYRETREQLKRNAVSSYTQRSRQIRNKTFDTATTGLGKGIANLPSFYANGFIGTYNGVIGKLVGKEAPYVPLIKDYNNPIEEEVGAWAADKFDRAAGMITGIRIGAVSSGRGTWNKNGKTGAGQKTGEMSVLDREMAGGNKPRKQTNNIEYGGGNRLATRERVDKNIQEIRSARYQAELGRASRLARELQHGKLPGTLQNNRKSTAREMPASQNPNATAEKFAETFLGRKPTLIERLDGAKLLKGKCVGCWNAKMPDGTFVTYRPAGNASSSTSTTTATVEINSSALNQLNIGKKGKPTSLKFKFPAK